MKKIKSKIKGLLRRIKRIFVKDKKATKKGKK